MYEVVEEQLKLFNLFLMADGKKTANEIEKMNLIYDVMKIDEVDREEIERYCDDALYINGTYDTSSQVIQIIKSILGEKNSDDNYLMLLTYKENLNNSKSKQVSTLWNLINLAYSDKEFSMPEKKIMNFLYDFWDIDNMIIQELEDSAETLVSLYSHKDWIKTTHKSYDEINKFIKVLDNDIKSVVNNIDIIINEIEL